MKYTNDLNLPEAFRLAVEGPEYVPSTDRDYYVTELIGSPQIRRLRNEHADEMVEDISDHVWRVFGQSAHTILYLASQHDKNPEHFYEQRLMYDVEMSKKRKVVVSAKLDVMYLDEASIMDWKVTSVYSVKDGPKPEWVAQLNFYRAMAWQNGYRINHLYAVAILKDWSASMLRRNPDLPRKAIQVMPVPVWDLKKTEAWIKHLVKRHEQKKMPECTPEERWETPTEYAVMRKGRKTAVRLFKDRALAEGFMADLGKDHEITVRPGSSRRCAEWCQVSKWCQQYAKQRAIEAGGVEVK